MSKYNYNNEENNMITMSTIKAMESFGDNDFLPDLPEKLIVNSEKGTTVALWADEDKTIAKVQEGDTFDYEKGVMIVLLKHYLGDDTLNLYLKQFSSESVEQEENFFNEGIKDNENEEIKSRKEHNIVLPYTVKTKRYGLMVGNSGIIGIVDYKDGTSKISGSGVHERGVIKKILMDLYRDDLKAYYKVKKISYFKYKGCFDSIESNFKNRKLSSTPRGIDRKDFYIK